MFKVPEFSTVWPREKGNRILSLLWVEVKSISYIIILHIVCIEMFMNTQKAKFKAEIHMYERTCLS